MHDSPRKTLPARLALPATLLVLAACEPAGEQPPAAPAGEQPVAPDTGAVVTEAEPSADLRFGIEEYAASRGGTGALAFRYASTDLNADGRPEHIVLLQGPDDCTESGCTMLVFRGDDEGALLVSSSAAIREPIRVSSVRAAGWKDLIVHSAGEGDVVLRFDGTRYPSDPSQQPPAAPEQVSAAQVLPLQQADQAPGG